MNEKEIQILLENILGKNSKIVHPLIGGMMNRSFVVEDNNNQEYVLYISTPEANEPSKPSLRKRKSKSS